MVALKCKFWLTAWCFHGASHIISLCYVHTKLLGSCPNKMNNIAFGATRKLLGPNFHPRRTAQIPTRIPDLLSPVAWRLPSGALGVDNSPTLGFLFGALQMGRSKKKRMNRDQLWHHLRTSAPVRWGEPRLWEEKEKESEKGKEEEPWRIVALLYKNLLSKWHHTARISREIILIYFDPFWSISIAPLLAWEALDKRVIWWRFTESTG